MDHRKLQEMIEACRSGSNDIGLPEMSPLSDRIDGDPELHDRYERTQRLDARLAQAIDDVEVPAGLRERILARLDAEAPPANGAAGASEVILAPVANLANGVAAAPASRRRWLRSIAAVAAGLLLLATGYAFWPRHSVLTYDRLLNLSSQWHQQLRANPIWQPLAPREAIRGFPLAEAIGPGARHWADVSSLVGQAACAYDLTVAGGRRATLFVIANDGQIAGSTPPLKPGSSTGGLMIGCWQSGAFVYVLVVEGDERAYRSLLDDAGPPLANFRRLREPPTRLQLEAAKSRWIAWSIERYGKIRGSRGIV
jgi:hypothetical protein